MVDEDYEDGSIPKHWVEPTWDRFEADIALATGMSERAYACRRKAYLDESSD
jgi:hypothetical protein